MSTIGERVAALISPDEAPQGASEVRMDDPGYEGTVVIDVIVEALRQVGKQTTTYVNKGNVASGTVTFNVQDGRVQKVNLTGDVTFAFTGAVNNELAIVDVLLSRDATQRSITYPASVVFLTGAIEASTDVEPYTFMSIDGGTIWYALDRGADSVAAQHFAWRTFT